MADLVAMDLVPEPTILAAALRACRRVNDYSLTTRILEITKVKCADNEAEFWPYIMQVTIISTSCGDGGGIRTIAMTVRTFTPSFVFLSLE